MCTHARACDCVYYCAYRFTSLSHSDRNNAFVYFLKGYYCTQIGNTLCTSCECIQLSIFLLCFAESATSGLPEDDVTSSPSEVDVPDEHHLIVILSN